MKYILILASLLLLFIPLASAGENSNIAFGGIGYFAPSSPDVRAFAGVAVPLNEAETIRSWNDLDIYPRSDGNFSVAGKRLQFEFKSGLSYDIYKLNGFTLFGLGAPGGVTDGDRIGLKFEYGGGIHRMISNRFGLMGLMTAETFKNFETENYETNFAPRFGVTFSF